jgi:hypothetical protein
MTHKHLSPWVDILSRAELEAYHRLTASLDPGFAERERAWWEGRTAGELRSTRGGAWYANDTHGYQMARSYLALLGEEA